MSAESAVCPHCGARSAKAGPAPRLSTDEVRALLALEKAASPSPAPSILGQFFLPHAATTGAALAAELVLTVLGLPSIIGALMMIVIARRWLNRFEANRGGEFGFAVLTGVFGGLVVWSILPLLGMSSGTALVIAVVALFALLGRAFVRSAARAPSDLFG